MVAKSSVTGLQRLLIVFGGLVLAVASLSLAQKILIPFALAVLLTFILSPVVTAIQHRGLGRVISAIAVMLLTLGLLVGVGWIVIAQIRGLANDIQKPENRERINQKIVGLQGDEEGVFTRLVKMGREISDDIQKMGQSTADADAAAKRIPVVVTSEQGVSLATLTGIALPILEVLATTFMVIILVTFMLIMREDLRNRLLRLLGHGRITNTTEALDDAAQRISRFLLMQSVINVLFGILLGVGLYFIHVPYALLWGVLGGSLRFIPYVGIWVAILMPFTYSIAIFDNWYQSLMVIGLAAVLEIVAANVLEPILLGHSTGISPLALLVAAVFWAWLWGPLGLLVSTPLTSCLVVLGKYVPTLEFLDVLLGSTPPLAPNVSFYQRLLARDQDEAEELVEEYLQTHPPETVYDDLLVSGLVFAKTDQQHGDLGEEEVNFIIQATKVILEDLPAPFPASEGEAGTASVAAGDRPKILVFGCPARNEADEIALGMFGKLLEPAGGRVEVLSDKALSAEMVTRVQKENPDLVVIAALPPGGLAQARYLIKRLKTRVPEVKIAVGRWGQKEGDEKMRQRLQAAGATYVGTTLLESRQQVLSLLPVVAAAAASADKTDITGGRKGEAVRGPHDFASA